MIEVYDALCLKEPWLELILLGIKTLETRTKCLFRDPRDLALASSKEYDERAWEDPTVGGRLDDVARARALAGLGKLRGFGHFTGFRPGVAGFDDQAACIAVGLPGGGVRFVSGVERVMRIAEVPTRRVRERDGEVQIVPGASQGLFRVQRTDVKYRGAA